MQTPRTLTSFSGALLISFILMGLEFRSLKFLVKYIYAVFLSLKVAPLRLSHVSASSTIFKSFI